MGPRQRRDRYQQPAPNKVIGNPVVALFGNHVYHFANHYGINQIIRKLLQSRKGTDPAPFLENTDKRGFQAQKLGSLRNKNHSLNFLKDGIFENENHLKKLPKLYHSDRKIIF